MGARWNEWPALASWVLEQWAHKESLTLCMSLLPGMTSFACPGIFSRHFLSFSNTGPFPGSWSKTQVLPEKTPGGPHGARINTINFHSLLYQPVSPKRNITSEQTRLPRSCLTSWNAWLLFHRVKKVVLKNTRKCNTVREEQGRLSATHRGMLTTHLRPVNSSVEWNNTELSWWSADSCSEAA